MFITNGLILTNKGLVSGKTLKIENQKIKAILDLDMTPGKNDNLLSPQSIQDDNTGISDKDQVIDAEGAYILPGFIDIHTHGGAGSDVMDSTVEDFVNISRFHASHGATGILATTLTVPMEEIIECLNVMRKVHNKNIGGCRILGAHLEGPFLSYENKGAHLPEYLLEPSRKNYEALLEYTDIIKSITVAPELNGMPDMIKEFAKRGVIISGGHDTAIDEEILTAIECGMTHTTHAFCVMSKIAKKNGHKHLGLCEMMLLDDRLTTELIADNKHIPELLVRLVYKNKGAKGMCVVSDCLRAAGMPIDDTKYKIGPKNSKSGYEVVVDDGVAMMPDRVLHAGSITAMDTMLKNLVEDCSIPFEDAVRMVSLTPAEIIRADNSKGSLEPGKDADICIMNRNYKVLKTYVEGELVYDYNNK